MIASWESGIAFGLERFCGNETSASESFDQFGAGPMQPGLDGTDWPADGVRDLLIALTAFMVKHEYDSIIASEIIDRGTNLSMQLGGIIFRPMVRCFVKIVGELGAFSASTNPRAAAIHRDAHDPGAERSIRIPTPQASEDAEENFLRHILGVVLVGQQSGTEAEHIRLKLLDQFPARGRFASEAAADEHGVGHGHPSTGEYPATECGVSRK
jgi:hypothetical protein